MLKAFLQDESGATAIEYGLVATLIAIAIVAGASSIGDAVSNKTGTIADRVSNA